MTSDRRRYFYECEGFVARLAGSLSALSSEQTSSVVLHDLIDVGHQSVDFIQHSTFALLYLMGNAQRKIMDCEAGK